MDGKITLYLTDDDAADVFITLGDLLAGEIDDLGAEHTADWTGHRLEAIGRHALALGAYATALGLARGRAELAREEGRAPGTPVDPFM